MINLTIFNPGDQPIAIAPVSIDDIVCFSCMFPATPVIGGHFRFEDLDAGLEDMPDWFFEEYSGLNSAIENALGALVPGGFVRFLEE